MTPMPRYETTHLLCSFWSRLLASVVCLVSMPCLLHPLARATEGLRREREDTVDHAIVPLFSYYWHGLTCLPVSSRSHVSCPRAREEEKGDIEETNRRDI